MFLNPFNTGQAEPLDKSRFPRYRRCCANVAPSIAKTRRVGVACHVALDVASDIVAMVRLLSASVLRSRCPNNE